MKILILGTSNSILAGGWVGGFKSDFPHAEIHNASIGANPGIQFASRLHAALVSYDYVIFDSILNDENLGRFIGRKADQDQLMSEILSTIAAKINLVVLGFTNRRNFDVVSTEYQTCKAISEGANAQFVGFRDLVARHRRALKDLHRTLYRDGAHIAIPIANMLGRALARALKRVERWHRNDLPEFGDIRWQATGLDDGSGP